MTTWDGNLPARLPPEIEPEVDNLEGIRGVASFLAGTVLAPTVRILDAAADELEKLRSQAGIKPVEIHLCGKRPHHMGEPCDRRAGHPNMHSWQIGNMVRIRSDYDVAISQLRQARHTVAELDRRLALAEADRDQLLKERASRRWRFPIPRRRRED